MTLKALIIHENESNERKQGKGAHIITKFGIRCPHGIMKVSNG